MSILLQQLVIYLGFFITAAFVANANAGVNNYLVELDSESIKTFYNKDSVLTISKNSVEKYDYYFRTGSSEIRVYNNLSSRFVFVRKYGLSASIVLGKYFDLKSKKSFIAVFSFSNGVRSYNEQICEKQNTMENLTNIEKDFTSLLEKLSPVDEEKLFDAATCGKFQNKSAIVGSLLKSVTKANESFKKCLLETQVVKNKLSESDEFRRIMITYYTNAMRFAKGFFSGENQIKFHCGTDKNPRIEPGPSNGRSPHKLHLPQSIGESELSGNQKQNLSIAFSKVIMHELNHVFFQVPSVKNPNQCEHEYKDLVTNACAALSSFKIPKCEIGTDTIVGQVNYAGVVRQGHALDAIDGNTGSAREAVEPNPTRDEVASPNSATGVTATAQTKPLALASSQEMTDSASPRPQAIGASEITEKVETNLTTAQAATVTRVGEAVFGPAETRNTRVRDMTDDLFRSNNKATEIRMAGNIANEFDRTVKLFDGTANRLKAVLVDTAVAATVPLQGPAGASASQWPIQNAVDAYLAGSASAGATVPGSLSLKSSNALASNSALPVGGGDQMNRGTSAGGTLAVAGSGDQRTGSPSVAGKISTSGGISAVASGAGSGGQKVAVGSNRQASNSGVTATEVAESTPESNPYQPRSNNGISVKDNPQFRLLATPNVTISGTTYKEMRESYNKKEFQDGLRGLEYAIEIVDGSGKVTSVIPAASGSRQPSSIVSKPGTQNQAAPKAIFIDNGSSIKRKNP